MIGEEMSILAQKAMAYDLLQIFGKDPEKTYTAKELETLLAAYIKGLAQ